MLLCLFVLCFFSGQSNSIVSQIQNLIFCIYVGSSVELCRQQMYLGVDLVWNRMHANGSICETVDRTEKSEYSSLCFPA